MDKIPQDQAMTPGDTIITSGLGGDIPKGLIVGTVQSVNRSDNEVFQTAQLASPVKFNKLELVFVVVAQ
jgi:rod shape-determining protein MreC